MSIRTFFDRIGHDIKVVAVDIEKGFKAVFTDLFGAQALTTLETTAEELFSTDFGKAIIADAEALVVKVAAGSMTVGSAIITMAGDIVTQGEKAGKSIGTTLATLVASMAVAKAQGAITALPAASAAPDTPTAP